MIFIIRDNNGKCQITVGKKKDQWTIMQNSFQYSSLFFIKESKSYFVSYNKPWQPLPEASEDSGQSSRLSDRQEEKERKKKEKNINSKKHSNIIINCPHQNYADLVT